MAKAAPTVGLAEATAVMEVTAVQEGSQGLEEQTAVQPGRHTGGSPAAKRVAPVAARAGDLAEHSAELLAADWQAVLGVALKAMEAHLVAPAEMVVREGQRAATGQRSGWQ